MRDHGLVRPRFWTGSTGRALRGDPAAQVLALYLQTAPTANLIGLYYLPLTAICHETGLASPAVKAALDRLEAEGFARYDHDEEIVWVVNMAREQVGRECRAEGKEGKRPDKKRPAILRELEQCGSATLRAAFTEHYVNAYELSPFEAPSKPLRSPFVECVNPLPRGSGEAGCPPDPDPAPDSDPDLGSAPSSARVKGPALAPGPAPAWDAAAFANAWTLAAVSLTVDKSAPHFREAVERVALGAAAAKVPVEEWAKRLLDRFKTIPVPSVIRQRSVEAFWNYLEWCESDRPVETLTHSRAGPQRGRPTKPDPERSDKWE